MKVYPDHWEGKPVKIIRTLDSFKPELISHFKTPEGKEFCKQIFLFLLKQPKNFMHEDKLGVLNFNEKRWYDILKADPAAYLSYLTLFGYVEEFGVKTLKGKGYWNSYFKYTTKGKIAFEKDT